MTPTLNRRRPRYTLRSLFVVMTLAAVVCFIAPTSTQSIYRHYFESKTAKWQRLFEERLERDRQRRGPYKEFEAPEVDQLPGLPSVTT